MSSSVDRRRRHFVSIARAAPAMTIAGVLIYLSDQRTVKLADDPGLNSSLHDLGHFVGYIALGFFAGIAISGFRTRRKFLFVFLALVPFAISDEVHQAFVPGRDPTVQDVVIDSVGAVIGMGLLTILLRWHRQRNANDRPSRPRSEIS